MAFIPQLRTFIFELMTMLMLCIRVNEVAFQSHQVDEIRMIRLEWV